MSLTVFSSAANGQTGNNTLPAANVNGVQTINVRAVSALATNVTTVAATAGATAINANQATSAVTITGLAAGATAGMIGNGVVANGALNFGYAVADSAATLNISNGTTGGAVAITSTPVSVTVNSNGTVANTIASLALGTKATALNVNAAAALNTGDITKFTGTAAKITVTGAAANIAATSTAAAKGAVNLGTIEDTTVKTIDASGLTAGGIETTLSTNATISVKGGAGADIITTGAVLTTGAVDAGASTADILNIADATHVASAALGAKYVNFEILSLNADQNVSYVSGITSLQLNAMTSKTISGISAALATAITVKGTQTTGLALNLTDATGSADVITLNLKSDTATSNVSVAGLGIAGVETLNIIGTTGTAATSSNVAFAANGATTLTAINISGTADVGLDGSNTAKAVTVASTTTGIATISGNFKNASSITTGAGKDSITLGTGFATYNSGAADDAFSGTVAQINTGANYNTMNGGDGVDTLNITDGATNAVTLIDNNFRNLSNIEKIAITDTTTANQSVTTGGWFDAAFKAAGVELTTASTKGNITIDMTTFTGASKLSVTSVGTGATEGALNIQTGSGADDVTVSAAAAGEPGVVKTFGGNDKITTKSTEAFAITAGQGNDTIALGSTGIETLIYEATAALNGADAITGFEFGAGKDILNVASFINAVKAETLGASIANGIDATAKNVLTLVDIQTLTSSNFGAAATNTVIKTAASQKIYVISDITADIDSIQNVYFVTTDASNVATVTLVGNINEGSFNAGNFVTA